jgi:hypothetical protein
MKWNEMPCNRKEDLQHFRDIFKFKEYAKQITSKKKAVSRVVLVACYKIKWNVALLTVTAVRTSNPIQISYLSMSHIRFALRNMKQTEKLHLYTY